MYLRMLIYLAAGPMFLISIGSYVYIQLRFKPNSDELDDYYWEVEDRHPGLARYNKWSRITLTATAASALLLFAAAFI